MYDLLKHLNAHLNVPHANAIAPDTKQVLQEAPKKIRSVPFLGIRPISMSSYSGNASEALAFLDKQFLTPSVPSLPPVVYPKSAVSSRNSMMTAIEIVTALNILRDLPEEVENVDYFKVLDHITSLVISSMKKTAESYNSDVLEARSRHLAGVDPATRIELVNQPLFGDTLYTDYKKLLVLPIRPNATRGQFRHFRASRGGHSPRGASWSPSRSSAEVPSTSTSGWGAPPAPVDSWNPVSCRGRPPRRPWGVRRGRQ